MTKSTPTKSVFDKYTIIKSPLFTESSMKQIEEHNTLTFLVDPRANKHQIAAAIKALHDVDVIKVNTLIRYVARVSLSMPANGGLQILRGVVPQSPWLTTVAVPCVSISHSPDGKKKAYCRLHADTEALDVANRIGLI